jgi:hypothetical protein
MCTLKFNLTLFIFYHDRLLNRNWRNHAEEQIIRTRERFYATNAADALGQHTVAKPVRP